MSGKYRTLLALWLGLFAVSIVVLLVNLGPTRTESDPDLPAIPEIGGENGEGGNQETGAVSWSVMLSAVSAFISAAGFIATTYFALRHDRREAALTRLEIEKLAGEIERQRLEIERLKRGAPQDDDLTPKR